VNVFDVVNYEWLVISKESAQSLSERLSSEKKLKSKPIATKKAKAKKSAEAKA